MHYLLDIVAIAWARLRLHECSTPIFKIRGLFWFEISKHYEHLWQILSLWFLRSIVCLVHQFLKKDGFNKFCKRYWGHHTFSKYVFLPNHISLFQAHLFAYCSWIFSPRSDWKADVLTYTYIILGCLNRFQVSHMRFNYRTIFRWAVKWIVGNWRLYWLAVFINYNG